MASLAWDIGWGDEKIVVGLFDDGGDSKGHPDLRLSPSGMNWTTAPYSKPPWTISSAAHHSTACAGTVGAIGDNNIGVVGVALGVTILPKLAASASSVLRVITFAMPSRKRLSTAGKGKASCFLLRRAMGA